MKKTNKVLVLYDKNFDFAAPSKCLGHPHGFLEYTLRTVAIDKWLTNYGLWSKCSPEIRRMVVAFLITALLRYNSYTMEFTHLKYKFQWF